MAFLVPIDQVVNSYLGAKLREEGLRWRDMAVKSHYSRPQHWRIRQRMFAGQLDLFSQAAGEVHLTEFEAECLRRLLGLLEVDTIPPIDNSEVQAVLAAFVLLTGRYRTATKYLQFYAPTNQFHHSFMKLLRSMEPALEDRALETMGLVLRKNLYDFPDDATVPKRFVVFYGTIFGDAAFQRRIIRSTEYARAPVVQLARFIGPMLGRHQETRIIASEEWLRKSRTDQSLRNVDVKHTLEYYGGVPATMDNILEDLSNEDMWALWPSCINTAVNHLIHSPEESSLWLTHHARRDAERLQQIEMNLAGSFKDNYQILNAARRSFADEAQKISHGLANLLGG